MRGTEFQPGPAGPGPAAAMPSEPRPVLERGQRGPNFALRSTQGNIERFYDRFVGNLVLLLLYPSQQAPGADEALRNLAAATAALEQADVGAIAVGRDDLDSLRATRTALRLDFPMYWDGEGKVGIAYGLDSVADGGCLAYLFDRNQRVLAAFPGGSDQAERALAYLAEEAPQRPAARVVTQQAPVLLVPGVFSPELCQQAIDAWRGSHDEGQVAMPERAYADDAQERPANTQYLSLKKRLDHVADDQLNPVLMNVIRTRVAPELRKSFQFRFGAMERVCIGAYDAGRGDYFRPHRDNITERTRDRSFAITLNLNDDYEGGGVRFAEFSDDVYRPQAGGALIFSCSLLHEALPVTKGTRFGAFTFFYPHGHQADNPLPR